MKKNSVQTYNRLINEKNPYLLQHASNPVDWYPWCDEIFEKAETEDKPIFLSIGYSTCHWCHVMAHESFEDDEIAALMNDAFINIKVDREERPDIDGIYMEVCQMLTGSGGWPLTIIMTPDKKPFFAGTYFPKESVYGRIGMKELIPQVSEIWKNKREDIELSANDLIRRLSTNALQVPTENLSPEIIKETFDILTSNFDDEYGGFGSSPKFPVPHNLTFLLRYYFSNRNMDALNMVEKTLMKMSIGGIYDHIGFGFHRYSTDSQWLVPHFEKMLYDQALITIVLTETYQLTKNEFYRIKIDEILNYVLRDMTSLDGAFYSAEDADSEGIEGKFYLWDANELKSVLGQDYELFKEIYNIRDNGNFDTGGGHFPENQNIIHLQNSVSAISEKLDIPEDELLTKISSLRKKLFDIRERRIHPHKDDKILTDWNGLMIAAYSKAGFVFNNEEYIRIAENASNFIENKMFDSDGRLLHRFMGGEAGIFANLDDYAFYIFGLLELYESTFKLHYLKLALKLTNYVIEHFSDVKNGGFYFTPDYAEKLIVRKKEIYDGAIPSGNSLMLKNLLRLWKITSDNKFKQYADNLIKCFNGSITRMPSGYTEFLNGFEFAINNSIEIVLVAEKQEDIKTYLNILRRNFIPNKAVMLKTNDNQKELTDIASFTKEMKIQRSQPRVYICKNFSCNIPLTDVKEFEKKLC
jgi:uncharacterized protein